MYAQVVVLTYQSPDIDSYTYKIPKNIERQIKIGQLVEVPFGERSPQGVIIKTFSKVSNLTRETKPITSVFSPQPLLLPYQIELLKWMSAYYLSPMVNCLKAILPELPSSPSLVHSSQYKETQTVNQTLVVVPTINQIPQTLAQFPKAKNHALYHNELKMGEKFSTWLRILSGKVDYIFGSRSAIFAPCLNLKDIMIYDEHDTAYKDARSPYFDTLTVAQKISELTGCDIRIFDSSPKITTYSLFGKHLGGVYYKTAKLHLTGEMRTGSVKIISMHNEKLAGNFSPISTFLQDQLKKNQNSLLFLNKKKESGSIYCKNCKFNDYFEKQPDHCPKCQSRGIYFNVLNVNSLSTEVKKLARPSAIGNRQSAIQIATASIFYSPLTTKFDLVACIQADSLLSRADFSSVETLYAQIANLKKMLNENGLLIIQTYSPDDTTLKSAAFSNYLQYFKDQLENRRLLIYPPFALLVKLTIKGARRKKAEKDVHELANKLKTAIQLSNYPTIQLLGPYEPVFFSKRTTFNIIIKYKLSSYNLKQREEAIKNISPILKEISKKAQIVVEPDSMN